MQKGKKTTNQRVIVSGIYRKLYFPTWWGYPCFLFAFTSIINSYRVGKWLN